MKKLLKRQQDDLVGNSNLPQMPSAVSGFYTEIDTVNLWQGDVYHRSSFKPNAQIPTDKIEYWMIINRTCQLYSNPEKERKIKLTHLNFIAVYQLKDYLDYGNGKNTKKLNKQIDWIINKDENVIFLPESSHHNLDTPLIGLFNLIFTVNTEFSPEASQKKLQLSSPFSEHVFQKLSRFFYSVGFDDENLKIKTYYQKWADEMEKYRPSKK
ncbi:MAG: hypothetical protein HQ517_14065 [SAR324 cluster bacterium]|nr:hypothetical protein [SAR324 cluster bacterium]